MIDKTQNPAEIYLVPVFDGDHDHVWCDTPAPGEGMREEDATRYVREDVYLATLAQVKRMRKYGNLCAANLSLSKDPFARKYKALWRKAAEATPVQCLAELEAQAYKQGFEACIDAAIDLGYLENDAYQCAQLRQQAKGGDL